MVFLIQNTQNRDALAVHLKLDELINAMESADDTLMRAEDETVEELEALKQKYEALSRQHDALSSELQRTKSARATSTSAGS
jgi:low affinity Fe/Cu permease